MCYLSVKMKQNDVRLLMTNNVTQQLYSDPIRFQQIILWLLFYCIRHTNEGSIMIKCSYQTQPAPNGQSASYLRVVI